MIFTSLRPFILSAIWLGLVGSVAAQVPPPPPPQLVSFFMVGGQELMGEFAKEDKPASFKFRTAKGVKQVTLVPGMPSPSFTRKAGSTISIFREQPSKESGKPPEVVTLAEAPVKATWRNVLVLLHLDENTDQITLKAVNQSFDALPAASVNFNNFTRQPLAIKIGSNQGIAPPQGALVLPIGLVGEETAMIPIQVAAEIDGQAQLVSSASYALGPKDRRTILIAPGQNSAIRMSILDPAQPDPVDTSATAIKAGLAK